MPDLLIPGVKRQSHIIGPVGPVSPVSPVGPVSPPDPETMARITGAITALPALGMICSRDDAG